MWAPAGGAPGQPYTLRFSAIDGQDEWIAATCELEAAGCCFFTTLAPGGTSMIITRAKTAFPLRRNGRGSLYLDGSVGSAGALDVPPVLGDPHVALLIDTGAQISIMGPGGARHLKNWSPCQRSIRGVGGVAVSSEGAGDLEVAFRALATGLWST